MSGMCDDMSVCLSLIKSQHQSVAWGDLSVAVSHSRQTQLACGPHDPRRCLKKKSLKKKYHRMYLKKKKCLFQAFNHSGRILSVETVSMCEFEQLHHPCPHRPPLCPALPCCALTSPPLPRSGTSLSWPSGSRWRPTSWV